MSFLTRLSHHRNLILPIAAGSAAVAASLYFSTERTIFNEPKVAFKGDDQWIDLKLKSFQDVSPDTRHLTFAFDSPDQESGLIVASCVMTKFVTEKGNNVIRPYTPISDPEQKGTVDFVIKRYPTGKMGNHIFSLKENDTLSFKGPIVKWKWTPNQYENVTLIGGGSGITPLYQLLHQLVKDPSEKTKVHLIYGNKTPEDILLKKELDDIASKYADRVKVTYFLDKPADNVKAETGYITRDWLRENIPHPDASHQVYVCGPPPLYEAISGNKVSPQDQGELTGALKDLGFTKDNVFKY